MLSKSKRQRYLCPYCNNDDIKHCKMYGQWSGWCNNQECRTWWPWKYKVKIDPYAPIPPLKKPIVIKIERCWLFRFLRWGYYAPGRSKTFVLYGVSLWPIKKKKKR